MNKEKKIIIAMIFLLCLGILFSYVYYLTEIKCYNQYRILTNQFIDSTNATHGGDCKEGCLFMETVIFSNPGLIGLDNYSKYRKSYLFFANEKTLREDLQLNKEIIVRWCPTKYGDRVRGITQ